MQIEKRQSNFELLRIISMLMIIFWHILIHGGIIANQSETLKVIISFIQPLLFVHVNSFILVTGYFQCNSKFRMSKVLQLNNAIWFYKAAIPFILVLFGGLTLSNLESIKLLSPISHYDYWFMTQYILLYLISPILNIIVHNINKEKYKKMLLLFFVVFSILPFITNQEVYPSSNGYTLLQFIVLYFIGAYFRKYNIDSNYYLKSISENSRRLIFLILFLFSGMISGFITLSADSFIGKNEIFSYIGNSFMNASNSYNNPFLIITSTAYFLYFGTFHFQNKFINLVSKLTLGVYLIHDNIYVRERIYDWLGFKSTSYSCSILLKILLFTFLIFISCSIIEWIRQKVFYFIYTRKKSKKFRQRYRKYIDSLGVPINW